MVIVLKPEVKAGQVAQLITTLESKGIQVHVTDGENCSILGLVGDTSRVDLEQIKAHDEVQQVFRVQSPYKLASRHFHPEDTEVKVGNHIINSNTITVIGGPCSVESESQLVETALAVKEAGAQILRGGAYKPRSSPYSFQGMQEEGLKLLKIASERSGLPFVTEAICTDTIEVVNEYADMIQIGARNMQNFALLKKAGRMNKPILLKRGFSSTIEEWLMSAEYIMSEGNKNVVLCERGIRTFEPYTRNTLDISAVPVIKELSHLPIIVDPSHATGKWNLVAPLAKASIAAGADGLIIEVHNDPEKALCDGAQSLKPSRFSDLVKTLEKYK